MIAKFTISSPQVDTLWGWISGMNWHPCLLAAVETDNDYAFATANLTGSGLVVRRNNLAQRNLSVIDVLASAAVTFPFLAGHVLNADTAMEIVVDRSRLPRAMSLLLALDDDGRAFPLVDLRPTITPTERDGRGIVFLERTKIEAVLGCCRGVLTLEKGSRFDCPPTVRLEDVRIQGGEVIVRDKQRFVEIRDEIAVIRMEKQPNQVYPLALRTTIPAEAREGDAYFIAVAQRSPRGETVGGATVHYRVR